MKFGLVTPKKTPSLNSQSSSDESGGSNALMWIFAIVVIIIIVSFGCWTTTDSFTNFKSKFMKTESLKDIDVIMFMSPKCGYCQRMLAVIDAEGKRNDLKIIDVTTDAGKKIAKEYGSDSQPVPSFISLKYKTGWVGSLPSTAELVKKLSKSGSAMANAPVGGASGGASGGARGAVGGASGASGATGAISDMKIIMFSREGCPHCVNAKMKLEEAGLLGVIIPVDVTTDQGQQKIQELGLEINGVPTFYSMKNRKMTSGFRSIETVIEELK